jgi:serine/threonine protein phosphatase PrpC
MLDLDIAVVTHVGKVRTHNEDSVLFVRPSEPDVLERHGVMALVADGMGGHRAGEHASKLAVETITRSYFDSREEPRQALLNAFAAANKGVFEAAAEEPAWKGMGTTCVAVAICREVMWWAWVGDSRMYLVRNGTIFRMTEDHTVVQDMVRRGWMTKEEAANHDDRNMLDRAIGTRESVEAGICDSALRIEKRDRLVLCSDGLHDLIRDDEMAEWVGDGGAHEYAEKLLAMALKRGGHDNISVVVLEAKAKSAERKASPTRENVVV